MDYSFTGAFLVGLMGAGHCLGMCGGLIGALSSQLKFDPTQNQLKQILGYQLSYNLGRISSYTLSGALCGALTSGLGILFALDSYLIILRLFAGVMMILTGLYISRLWTGLNRIEKIGQIFWKQIQPLASKYIPLRNPQQALVAGMLWGWLPCGLVYSMLTWAVASASVYKGALIMLAFGAGTLPALFSVGIAGNKFTLWIQSKFIRMLSALALSGFGIQTLYIGISQLYH